MRTPPRGRADDRLPDPPRGPLSGRAPGEPPPLPHPGAALDGALARPLGRPALGRFLEPGDRVAVVLQPGLPSAVTELALPKVLEAARQAGASQTIIRVAEAAPPAPSPQAFENLGRGGFEALGRVRRLGTVRIDAEVATADKLILLGAGASPPAGPIASHALRVCDANSPAEPEAGKRRRALSRVARAGEIAPMGGGAILALGCADPETRAAILAEGLEGEPLQEVLDSILAIAPPAFLIQLGLQRGRRLAAIFAGDPHRAFAASTDFHAKWSRD